MMERRGFLKLQLALATGLLAGCGERGRAITVYSSMPRDILQKLAKAFTAHSGIAVQIWRGDSYEVATRVSSEAKGGIAGCDVVELDVMRLRILQKDALFRDAPDDTAGFLTPSRVIAFCLGYNTGAINPALLSQDLECLINPAFRNRVVLNTEDAKWFIMVRKVLGEARVGAFFAALARQGFIACKGHTLAAELLAAGEFALSPTMFDYKMAQLRDAGKPIDSRYLSPVIADQHGMGIRAGTPRLEDARAFVAFVHGPAGAEILTQCHVRTGTLEAFQASRPDLRIVTPGPDDLQDEAALRQATDAYAAFLRLGTRREERQTGA